MINLEKQKKINVFRLIFFIFVITISLLILFKIPRVTIPLGLSYVLYLFTSPIYEQLTNLKVPKLVANLSLVFGIIYCFVFPLSQLLPLLEKESKNFDKYLPIVEFHLKNYYFVAQDYIEKKTTYKISNNFILDVLGASKGYFKDLALEIPKVLGNILEWFLVIPLLLFFMLKDGKVFKKLILRITPNSIFEKTYSVGHQFNKKLGGYMLAKAFEATLLGLMITLCLFIAGVDFAFILGLIAAVTNIIPYVGPILGTVPGLVIVLAKYGQGNLLYAVFFIYMIANLIDLAIIFPLLVSKIVDLHPVVVVLSVILGSQYFGLVGMVVSIPVAAALKIIGQELFEEFYLT